MKFDKYFELAKVHGVEVLELYVERSYALSFSLFHRELDSYTLSDKHVLAARGIYKGKMGYAYSEKLDKTTPEFILKQIVENATNIDKEDEPIIFKGSAKYNKYNPANPKLAMMPIDEKITLLHEVEDKLKAADERITEIGGCSYEETATELMIANSYGLKLKQKFNYFFVYANAVAKDGEEVKTGYKIHLGNNPYEFKVDEFVKEVAHEVTSKLGGKPCPSKKYRAMLSPKVVNSLLQALVSSAVADEVQKHSSLFENKLNQQVASKKITVLEAPLTKNIFFRAFDDEGVATYKKAIIEKGVLKTYLYNLETAKKDNVTSTGNGYRPGAKAAIDTSTANIVLKPGKKSESALMAGIKEGIYISEVEGLHAGLNTQSGNFSLQASGFMIKDGKLAQPVSLITIAGNLMEVFKDVSAVANNLTLHISSSSTPSLLIKKIAVSGK